MSRIVSFLKLIRFPNLIFILFTQSLFYFLFFHSYRSYTAGAFQYAVKLSQGLFGVLVFTSVSIAAAGYIINDYFDIEIDLINKPQRVLVGRTIGKKTSLLLYLLLNLSGLSASCYLSVKLDNYLILIFNGIASVSLFIYSRRLKKKLLAGNILISILTAWTIVILPVSEFGFSRQDLPVFQTIWTASIVYGAFAFIISLIREVVKDMEDAEGDKMAGCTTVPIVAGVFRAKIYAGALLLVLLAMVSVFIIRSFASWGRTIAVYGIVFLITPLIFSFIKLYYSQKPHEFHKLSGLIKWIMLSGILSMIFF